MICPGTATVQVDGSVNHVRSKASQILTPDIFGASRFGQGDLIRFHVQRIYTHGVGGIRSSNHEANEDPTSVVICAPLASHRVVIASQYQESHCTTQRVPANEMFNPDYAAYYQLHESPAKLKDGLHLMGRT